MTVGLDIGDPFEFFQKQAHAFRPKLSLPIEFLSEAINIVKGAFGEEWIREQVQARKRGNALPVKPHPIGSCFAVAGESQVVQIFEIAIYIKRLISVPNLDQVLEMMRENYSPGLLQLAYAYRFQRVGATNIELEPPSSGGRKADIYFELRNAPYLVECYIPRREEENTSYQLHYSVDRIFKSVENGIKRISIRLKRPINAADRKGIEAATIAAIRSMGGKLRAEIEIDAARILIEDVSQVAVDTDFPVPGTPGQVEVYGGADWGMNQQLLDADEIPALRVGKASRRLLNRIFVWRAPQEKRKETQEERIMELEKKLRRKLSQTRREDEPRRILIAQAPEAFDVDAGSQILMRQLQHRIVAKHRRIATILITSRAWMVGGRYRYGGYFMGGEMGFGLPEELRNEMIEQEESVDILQDWR